MLLLTDDEVAGLVRGDDLVRFPPVRKPLPELESFYARLVKQITRLTRSAEKTEWNHYGSGYASSVDAWFYFPDGRARGSLPGEHHRGVFVLLSRLSCFFVMGQAEKSWNKNGSGCSYLPQLKSIDSVRDAALQPLERKADLFLTASGLKRLHRDDLEPKIGSAHNVPTIFSQAPFTQFDALFYWED